MKKGTSKVNFKDKRTLTKITKMIKSGYTEESIAKSYGYSPTYFCELKKNVPELAEAIKAGKTHVDQLVVNEIFEIMFNRKHSKQATMLMFYAKCRMGWSEKQVIEEVVAKTIEKINVNVVKSEYINSKCDKE